MIMVIDAPEPMATTAIAGGAISAIAEEVRAGLESDLTDQVWAVVDFNGVMHDAPISYAAAEALMTSCGGRNGATIVTAAVAHKILLSQHKQKERSNNDNDS
jgi:hypothetical protein